MNFSLFNYSDLQLWNHSSFLIQNAPKPDDDSDTERSFHIYLYAFTMFLSFMANSSLVLVIMCTKSLRTKFNFFVVNFSLVNLLIPCFCMWLHLVYHLDKGQWRFGEFFCRINEFIQVLVVCVSNLTLTVTVLDRFLATLHSPLQKYTQDHVVIVMLFVWISGTLLSLPYILYTRFLEFNWIGGHERLCQAHFPSIESRRAYVTIFCLLGYVLPMLVMFFLISVALRRPLGVTRDNMTQEDRMRCQMKRRALHYVFTVLIVFFLCWSPQQFLMLWDVFRDRGLHAKLPKNIRQYSFYSYYMAYASSCVYPFLYMTFNKGFRFAINQLLHCSKQPRADMHSPVMEINDQNIEDGNLDSFDSCSLQNTNDPDMASRPTGNLSTVATIEGHDQTSKL
ncbi:prolactin-releasing peptide receptor-like [Crassostrea virginica]